MRSGPKMTVREATNWHPRFAWWPKRMTDGAVVWLERYERRLMLIPDLDPALRFLFGPGHWQYRATRPAQESTDE